ncbi:MAG: hypothetical protein QF704_01585 [Anaerolineales bacterium]|jgi:TM2 domain-containing membrane protein YozV|nr:hypothetical protein [Anaerolineales bacterium]
MLNRNKEQIYLYGSLIILALISATILGYATMRVPTNISALADGILVLLLIPIIVFAGLTLIFLLVLSYYLGRLYNSVKSLLDNLQIFTKRANRSAIRYAQKTSTQINQFNRIIQIPLNAMGYLRRQFTNLF